MSLRPVPSLYPPCKLCDPLCDPQSMHGTVWQLSHTVMSCIHIVPATKALIASYRTMVWPSQHKRSEFCIAPSCTSLVHYVLCVAATRNPFLNCIGMNVVMKLTLPDFLAASDFEEEVQKTHCWIGVLGVECLPLTLSARVGGIGPGHDLTPGRWCSWFTQ